MKNLYLFVILSTSCVFAEDTKKIIALSRIVAQINSNPLSSWKAHNYGFDLLDIEEAQSKLGLITTHYQKNPIKVGLNNVINNQKLGNFYFNILPRSYDARKQYPYCKSIRYIRDQANCGSCWAVSAASVISDRFCIHSHGKYNIILSGHYTLSCDSSNYGCLGGYLENLWKFYEKNGIITGDEFESDIGCQPYGIRPCGWPTKLPCARTLALTPKCKYYACTNEWYKNSKEVNLFKISDYYQVGNQYISFFNEYAIKLEIHKNGPVQASMLVYEDFFTYHSGVYRHEFNPLENPVGGHAVKIIGWGEQKGVKYWLVANSWGNDWGENGLFKIIRGENNCRIETNVFAGTPKIANENDDDDDDDDDDSD